MIQEKLTSKELTMKFLEPYAIPDECPYLSEDQRELSTLSITKRLEWMAEWLYMANEMEKQFNIKEAAENLKKRYESRKHSRKKLFKKAEADSKTIIEMIINEYDPQKIYQWGSLLKPEHFDENSDIDIAIEGLKSAEEFFSLYGRVMEMTDFPVDIVEMEKIESVHRESIRSKGKLVYERKK